MESTDTEIMAAPESKAEAPVVELALPIIHGHEPPPGFVERDGDLVLFKTAEEWARAKGMLPELIEVATPFARAGATPARQYNPQFWKFNATKAGSGWPEGKELTEAEFDAAVMHATTGHQYR